MIVFKTEEIRSAKSIRNFTIPNLKYICFSYTMRNLNPERKYKEKNDPSTNHLKAHHLPAESDRSLYSRQRRFVGQI